MREIKFRGLYINPQTKVRVMVYGDFVHNRYINSGMPEYAIECRDEKGVFTAYSVDPNTIGQYTGLKDKNGKEVYEGDIVTRKGRIYKIIEWDNYNACFNFRPYLKTNYEVIGNVWENPELLT